MNICSIIIRFIEWYEPRLAHLKFMFSPMPTYDGFAESLQWDMINRPEAWMKNRYFTYSYLFQKYFLPKWRALNNKESRLWRRFWLGYIPLYWETTKIDVARTVARMCANGGIRRLK